MIEINSLMEVILVTGEYVYKKKKSGLSFCLKPLATSLAFYLSIDPSTFNFLLKIHLQDKG